MVIGYMPLTHRLSRKQRKGFKGMRITPFFTARKFMLGVPLCALPGNPGIVSTRLWGRSDV